MTVTRILVCVLATGLAVPSAGAAPGPQKPCRDGSRTCVIEAATTYLDALVSHDSASVRLAPGAWRMVNGRVDARSADELRGAIEREPVAAVRDVRWVVEGEDAVAVYDLDADLTRAAQSATFGPADSHIPAYVIERFKVRRGLIHEIEVVYWGDPARSPRPDRPFRGGDVGQGPCPDDSRACVVEAAGAYLDALVSHDGSAVPLASDAWRIENGSNSGDDGEAIRAGLESPVMNVIVAMEDVRWVVEGEQAVALYRIWTDAGPLAGSASGPRELQVPAYIFERFRVQDGLIKEIEAVFTVGPPGVPPDERPT